MIDLMNKTLPDTIEVDGEVFLIDTDFRVWMKFVDCFEKWDKMGTIDISYLFVDKVPTFYQRSDYDGIFEFAFPKSELPRSETSGERVLDYVLDADYIYSAFIQQYGIDLLEVDMHWHKFRALLSGIGGGTRLHEIMGYRSYTSEKIKSQDDMYRRLKSMWELPQILTKEEQEAEDKFNDYFG